MLWLAASLALAGVSVLLHGCGGNTDEVAEDIVSGPFTATVLSEPVRLRYGEVYNTFMGLLPLPEDVVARYSSGDKKMAITGFKLDIVRVDDEGRETQVLLNDHYLHHAVLNMGEGPAMQAMHEAVKTDQHWKHMLTGCHAMTRRGAHAFFSDLSRKSNGKLAQLSSAQGAEYRHSNFTFKGPFAMVLSRPEVWAPVVHMINTNKPHAELPYSPLLECPCTPQRKINVTEGTIDGVRPSPRFACGDDFAATGNPSCQLATYAGGWRCCEHGMFVADTDKECSRPDCSDQPASEVRLKLMFSYEDATKETRNVETSACCDVTGASQGFDNIEYDIPQCAEGTATDECVHVAETVQPVGFFGHYSRFKASDLVDLVFAGPHLHLSGISLELIDDVTKETICEVHRKDDNSGGVMYGSGAEPGNENGYLVGMRYCRWGGAEAHRFRRDHPLRTRAVYNASRSHFGVMSLWVMEVSAAGSASQVVF